MTWNIYLTTIVPMKVEEGKKRSHKSCFHRWFDVSFLHCCKLLSLWEVDISVSRFLREFKAESDFFQLVSSFNVPLLKSFYGSIFNYAFIWKCTQYFHLMNYSTFKLFSICISVFTCTRLLNHFSYSFDVIMTWW